MNILFKREDVNLKMGTVWRYNIADLKTYQFLRPQMKNNMPKISR